MRFFAVAATQCRSAFPALLLFPLLFATVAHAADTRVEPASKVAAALADPLPTPATGKPDAKVTVVNQETNTASTKNSSPDGSFTIINLLPGNYALTAEKSGFTVTIKFASSSWAASRIDLTAPATLPLVWMSSRIPDCRFSLGGA